MAQSGPGAVRLGGRARQGTYTHAPFLRLKARRGPKKAVIAVAGTLLTAAYYILRDCVEYKELGAGHFALRQRDEVALRLARRIQTLGYEVTLRKAA